MDMAAPIYYTAEMVRALPDDGKRYEVVRGELLVTPAPRAWHQEVIQRLAMALRGRARGRVLESLRYVPDIGARPALLGSRRRHSSLRAPAR